MKIKVDNVKKIWKYEKKYKILKKHFLIKKNPK